MEPKTATFSFEKFRVIKSSINFENTPSSMRLDFMPSGIFLKEERRFVLNFLFTAKSEDETTTDNVVSINCEAVYKFEDNISFESIPEYFYSNSIAIAFPYIRAFVSTITLQANVKPIILPTLNLTALNSLLKKNTIVK